MTSPLSGFGLGLRGPHYETVLRERPRTVDWFEVISENVMEGGDAHLGLLVDLRQDYAIIPHGVGLNLGGVDPLNQDYLRGLKQVVDRLDPPYFSDHVCWTGVDGVVLHDLLPVPYTEEALRHIAARAQRVMDYMERPLVVENASSYLRPAEGEMREWEFMAALAEEAGVGLLLDINNVYVNAANHGFDARRYVDAIPAHAIRQVHLAGHRQRGAWRIDTHDQPVCDEVWALYGYLLAQKGMVPTLVEWDADIPPFETLVAELDKARALAQAVWPVAA